jgi:hypothetical protein
MYGSMDKSKKIFDNLLDPYMDPEKGFALLFEFALDRIIQI